MIQAGMDDDVASGSGSEGAGGAALRGGADRPGLPYANAFVVQFSAETDRQLAHATGRVEHLQIGRRMRFGSTAELLAGIVALLVDDRNHPPEQGEQAARQGGDR